MSGVWDRVVGQDDAVARLEAAAESPVHAYLFVGPAGSGKRHAAQAFAALLLCPDRGCGECRACRLALAGAHPDLAVFERVGASLSAEQAEEIVHVSALAPMEGERRVVVIDEAHLMPDTIAAKLLKTVEEPSARTVIVVLADDVPAELTTVASRCVRIEFRALADAVVAAALEREGIDQATAHTAAAAARGDLDRARLLATDPELALRREAFRRVAARVDGNGATVIATVEELLGLVSSSLSPLAARQAEEARALEERVAVTGERGAGRKAMQDRHKRELRRHRRDELGAGLAALASAYRDGLAEGSIHDPAAAVAAVEAVHEAFEALERNPNEALLLQDLLFRLPPA